MQNTNALTQFAENPAIDRIAEPLSQAVREMYQAAGPLGQQAKNAVHGVWLGHPLHPVFTDVPPQLDASWNAKFKNSEAIFDGLPSAMHLCAGRNWSVRGARRR